MQIVYTGSEFYFAHAHRKFVKVVLYQKVIGLAALTIVESFMLVSGIAQSWLLAAQLYANLLDQLRTAICEKRRGKLSNGVLLQQDNARVHTCKVAMDVVKRNGYELIPHPAYLPDLVPSVMYRVFIYLKHHVYYVSINSFIYYVSKYNFLEQHVYNNMMFKSLILD